MGTASEGGPRDRAGVPPSGGARVHAPVASDAMVHLSARYWRRNLFLITVLMMIGFAVSFIGPFWARELSAIRFFGWPLPFYLGAQGAILVYLLLVILYAVAQRRNDAWFRQASAALRS